MMSNSNIITQHDIYDIYSNIWNMVVLFIFFLYFSCFLLQRLVTHIERNVTFGHQINVDFIFSILSDSASFFNLQKLLRGFA